MNSKKRMTISWYVYIVNCADNTLYTGITNDIARRLAEHNFSTKGAKYTRPRRPVTLVYQEQHSSRSAAAKREYAIKRLSPSAKKKLISSSIHKLLHQPFQD